MSLNMNDMGSKPKAKAPRIEEGTYMARISSIIDLGIQPQTDWQTGEATDPKPRALITYTLPTETLEKELEDGTVVSYPRVISKEVTLSNHEKSNLVALVRALKPGLADLKELLNAECMVSIGSTVTGNAKVTNVVKAPNGMPIDELENEPVFFDFDAPDEDVYKSLPRWIQEKLLDATNYNGFADGWVQEEAA